MTMPAAELHLRSYRDESLAHRHAFPQLVLPLSGRLELDIAGRMGQADAATAAFVETGAAHATRAVGANRALVLDLAPAMADDALLERLAPRPFLPLSPAAARLVDFMGLTLQQHPEPAPARLRHWLPLLLDTLALCTPRPASRLHALLAKVEADPGLPWSVQTMAATAAISASRLHEWFRQELDATPRAWLAELRMQRACELLRASALPLSEVALRCGYADQSALSKAMRRLRDTTPSACRRAASSGHA
jgi:AraC-like DNA-binding protein